MCKRRFVLLTHTLWLHLLVVVAILIVAREVMFTSFVEADHLAGRGCDVARMWLTGLRYDLQVAALSGIPVFASGLFCAFREKPWRLFGAATRGYLAVVHFVILFASATNYYYYETFQNHINILVFGLFEDDTNAVVANIWQDYPLLQVLLLCLGVSLGTYMLHRRLRSADGASGRADRRSKKLASVYVLATLLLFSVAARGSVGAFPLGRNSAQVSDLVSLNKLTPNGVMALVWAVCDHRAELAFEPVDEETGRRLMKSALGVDTLLERTPPSPYLDEHKPHVVLVMMEGLGSNMLTFDDPEKNDLLGDLRRHFEKDFLFMRFVSSGNSTASTLADLLFNSPVISISQSSAREVPLSGSAFRAYKEAGYRTIFITPGNMTWRNLAYYLPIQGVDILYDETSLMNLYPGSEQHRTDWGLPDEYAFDYVEQLLREADRPHFITILTITNHPPYVTPGIYKPGPVMVLEDYRERVAAGQIELSNILETFQYAADALGDFISNLKASDLSGRTLVAATADHSMRRIKARFPEESMLNKAVPFYLYVPDEILQRVPYHYDDNRVGSHKDIMPTLYSYSLSDGAYYSVGGRNMLAVDDEPGKAFGYNRAVWITGEGAYPLEGDIRFYPWANGHGLLARSEPMEAGDEGKRIEAFEDLRTWYINGQVRGTR